MALLLVLFSIASLFVDIIVSQGASLDPDISRKYNYKITQDASDSWTGSAFKFNDESDCFLFKYQNAKAEACKNKIETQTVIGRTNSFLSDTLRSDFSKLREADTKAASNLAKCGEDSNCRYVRQLEIYFTIRNIEKSTLRNINTLKEDAIKEIKKIMDACVEQ